MPSFLVTVLTSCDLTLLRSAVFSVKSLFESEKMTMVIIVNTFDDDYFERVKAEYDTPVIRTESNGYPGKGHNSCLAYFRDHPEYDYLTILDGDDLLYPTALQRLNAFIVKDPSIDVLQLMIQDKVECVDTKFEQKPIKYNFKLSGAFDRHINLWKDYDHPSPLMTSLQHRRAWLTTIKTPARPVLLGRKIFQTTLKIEYGEDFEVYDDALMFVSIYEAHLRGELNVQAISDSYIYCYNTLNPSSVTSHMKNSKRENKLFHEHMRKYTQMIENDWHLELFPFSVIALPTNYTIEEKILFCDEYIVSPCLRQYLILAKKLISSSDSKKGVKELKKICSYGVDNIAVLSQLLKRSGSDHSLLLLCDRYPHPKLYADAFKLFLNAGKDRCAYFSHLAKIYDAPVMQNTKNDKRVAFNINPDKELVCYYTGCTASFNGSNYNAQAVYGSEIAAIKLCEALSPFYNMVIVGNCPGLTECNGVTYLNEAFFVHLQSEFTINHFIISRFAGCLLNLDLSTVKCVYFLLHDISVNYFWSNKKTGTRRAVLPLKGLPLFYNFLPKFKRVIFVSEWQMIAFNNILKDNGYQRLKDDKQVIIPNGISIWPLPNSIKEPHKFVYCSDPERGLEVLIKALIKLRETWDDVTLHIYFGTPINIIFKKYIRDHDWISFYGKVSNDIVRHALGTTDFWVYPNVNSHETFCLSCLEAMQAGNVVVTRLSAEQKEIGHPLIDNTCGVLIPPEESSPVDFIVRTLTEMGSERKKELQTAAHTKAENYDWKRVSKKWSTLFQLN